jgi:hypothetical protein
MMFTSVYALIRRFESLIVEIDPSSIEPPILEERVAIVTRKITERMVAEGQSRE